MIKTLLRIAMPVYNAEVYIGETTDSILVHTHKDWDLIIINDASTDSTQKIIDSYIVKDNRI